MELPPVAGLSSALGAALGVRLRHLGLTREYVRSNVEPVDNLKSPLTAQRHALFSPLPAAIALRLLFCRATVTRVEMNAALGEDVTAAALDGGLLQDDRPAPFHLRTAGGLYVLSDYLDPNGAAGEAVMGAGETTAILWRAAQPPRRLSTALDLGCGAGTLALLLAAHADRVLGTDINPRAIEIARFNAALNGIENVDFQAGDLYTPAGPEPFDLIVSQPPYYPRRAGVELTFLHGGERGDEILRQVVAGVAGRLTPHGRALVFSSWPEEDGPDPIAGHNMLALTTNRRELHGTEQSLLAIESGNGWLAKRRLAPECWGEITSSDVDRLLATERWLHNPNGIGRLRLPPQARVLDEAGHRLLELPLVGLTPVDDALWEAVQKPEAAPEHLAREAARRGLLEWDPR